MNTQYSDFKTIKPVLDYFIRALFVDRTKEEQIELNKRQIKLGSLKSKINGKEV
jgi:low affinity Fe/Cu permease